MYRPYSELYSGQHPRPPRDRQRQRKPCGLSHRCIDTENSELPHLAFFPIELGFGEPRYRLGNPRFCSDRGIIERLAQMSAPYGTKITINDQGIGVVELK